MRFGRIMFLLASRGRGVECDKRAQVLYGSSIVVRKQKPFAPTKDQSINNEGRSIRSTTLYWNRHAPTHSRYFPFFSL